MPLPPLASLKGRKVYLSGASLPRLCWKKRPLNECCCCTEVTTAAVYLDEGPAAAALFALCDGFILSVTLPLMQSISVELSSTDDT